MENCLFCKIIAGEIPSWKVWENDAFIAILTPFPNTSGFTVLLTKNHYDSDVLGLDEKLYKDMLMSAKEVASLLNNSLSCKRTGLIIEGMGINHAHVKLIPMHGIPDGPWKQINSNIHTFSEKYKGFLSSYHMKSV